MKGHAAMDFWLFVFRETLAAVAMPWLEAAVMVDAMLSEPLRVAPIVTRT